MRQKGRDEVNAIDKILQGNCEVCGSTRIVRAWCTAEGKTERFCEEHEPPAPDPAEATLIGSLPRSAFEIEE